MYLCPFWSLDVDNLILIGMPGCGKSTLGVLLAKAMGMQFLDSDLLIQSYTGEKLQETIDTKGMDYFLAAEETVLLGIQTQNTVIATGGSAVYGDPAMMHLKSLGKVIYLSLSCDEIERRLWNIKTRGIAMNPEEGIRDVYARRIPLYKKYADFIVPMDGLTMEECVDRLTALFTSDAGSSV